jgi:hypothetical protein
MTDGPQVAKALTPECTNILIPSFVQEVRLLLQLQNTSHAVDILSFAGGNTHPRGAVAIGQRMAGQVMKMKCVLGSVNAA